MEDGKEKFLDEKWVEGFKLVTDGLFRKVFALYLITGAGSFLFKAAFRKEDPSQIMLIIVGFITGTVVTTLIQFYYGTSQSSQDKEEQANKIETIKAEEK